jgi:hypothetical protein
MRDHSPVKFILGALVMLPPLVLAVGAWTCRAKARPCCPADPSRDLRMRH